MLFRLIVPPLLYLLAILLIVFALTSPVPLHGSSLSLLYLMPVPAPAPLHAPTQSSSTLSVSATWSEVVAPSSATTPAPPAPSPMAYSASDDRIVPASMPPMLERRHVSYAPSAEQVSSHVRYTTGLLGSCYVDAHQAFHCTPSRLRPVYNATWLRTEPGMNTDTASLPTGLTSQPALVLVALLLLLGTSAVQVRRVYRQCTVPAEAPATERSTVLLVRMALYVQDGAAVLLLLIMIAMRVQAAHTIDAFRAANTGRVLGPEILLAPDPASSSVPLVWDVDAGTAFSAVTVAACLLLVTSWIERRRLTTERAPSTKRGSVSASAQASWPQRAWTTLVHTPLSAPMRETKPTISAPVPMYPVAPLKAYDASCKADSVSSTPIQEATLGPSTPPQSIR